MEGEAQTMSCCVMKSVKGLSKEELETRGELVLMPSERIQAIPDRSMVQQQLLYRYNTYLYSSGNCGLSLQYIVKLLAFVYCVVCSVADKMEAVIVTNLLGSSDDSSKDQELDINRMPILRAKVVGRSWEEASTSSLSPPPTVDDTSMEYNCMGGDEWDNSEDYEEEEYGGGNRFNFMTTNIAKSLNSILFDEREYPVAAIFNSIAHRFGEIFRKRYVEVNNSRTPFILVAKNILRKNMTEGDKFYMNNINRSTDKFAVLGCGPSAKVNLSRRHVLTGSLTW
ncbi:hypothetical protein FXO38_09051 [Capsicum annuum]|uniref:Uncharacterized protein n=1 Tax=Capsicum annuum TaxID=4072 RepID=A0A2G2YQX2_CAPAN|nr:hypothetical protein FXO37_25341 [Capsicum annuum]KAF3666473.1 hypothetical protein FXO38_09051 [Capsicum annuum]PHT72104.1 hypothetical protein T459_22889 [Capsicum annuum]